MAAGPNAGGGETKAAAPALHCWQGYKTESRSAQQRLGVVRVAGHQTHTASGMSLESFARPPLGPLEGNDRGNGGVDLARELIPSLVTIWPSGRPIVSTWVRFYEDEGAWKLWGSLFFPEPTPAAVRALPLHRILLAVEASGPLREALAARFDEQAPAPGTLEYYAAFTGRSHPRWRYRTRPRRHSSGSTNRATRPFGASSYCPQRS